MNESVCSERVDRERGQRWERPRQRFSSLVCVFVCVTPGLSLPELKEPAPDGEDSDTTRYCVGTGFNVERPSGVDSRWEINEPQLKESARKKTFFFEQKEEKIKPLGNTFLVTVKC